MQLSEYERGYAQALSDVCAHFAREADKVQSEIKNLEGAELDELGALLRKKITFMVAMSDVMKLERTWSKERRANEKG